MLNVKTAILLGVLLLLSSSELDAATPATAAPPAKPELWVEGGLLGAISSSIDQAQETFDLNDGLIDAWRLRTDRAAAEVGRLVNPPADRSGWSVGGDFLILSATWLASFVPLTLLAGLLVRRVCRHPWLRNQPRGQGVLTYLLAYTLPALMGLSLTLYVSHSLPASVGHALALCLAYATSSGIVSASVLLCLSVLFNIGHKRCAVRIIRDYCPKPLFLIGFFAALNDALSSPQIARQLGGNLTSSVAVCVGLLASAIFAVLVIRLRRPVAHLIRNRSLAQRLTQPALQASLRLFSGLWYWPFLLMVLVSAINLIRVDEGSQKTLRYALLTTVLLIGTLFLSSLLQHIFTSRNAQSIRGGSAYKARFLSLLHAVLRIVMAVAFLELFGRIWGVSLFEFAQRNTVGQAISDALSRTALIFLVTWLLWVLLDTAIHEALKPSFNAHASAREPSTRVKTILPLLRNAIKILLLVICTITTLANLGVNVAPLLAGAGVVGLAIGFGSQQLVQDVITGLFLIIEDTLSIGDWVVLDSGHAGSVEGLTIRTLRLRDGKGFVHSVPFGQIKAVTNQSRQFAYAFFSVQFTYDTDVDAAIELIREAGRSISEDPLLKYSLQGGLDVFGLDKMDLNGVVLTAQFRTVSGGQYAVNRAFNQRLKKLVDHSSRVHFAQIYPQTAVLPVPTLEQDAAPQDDSSLLLPESAHRP